VGHDSHWVERLGRKCTLLHITAHYCILLHITARYCACKLCSFLLFALSLSSPLAFVLSLSVLNICSLARSCLSSYNTRVLAVAVCASRASCGSSRVSSILCNTTPSNEKHDVSLTLGCINEFRPPEPTLFSNPSAESLWGPCILLRAVCCSFESGIGVCPEMIARSRTVGIHKFIRVVEHESLIS